MGSCRHSEKEGGGKSNSRTIKCLESQASCSHGCRRGTEVREAGIRLVHKLSLQIMCSSAHPRYARFCSGPTHTNTLAQACLYTHTLACPEWFPQPFVMMKTSHIPQGDWTWTWLRNSGDGAEPSTGPWQGRSLARFFSYKAHCGPGLEGGLGKCERWWGHCTGTLSHPPGLRTLVFRHRHSCFPGSSMSWTQTHIRMKEICWYFLHEVVTPEVFHRNGDLGQRWTHRKMCAGEFMQ